MTCVADRDLSTGHSAPPKIPFADRKWFFRGNGSRLAPGGEDFSRAIVHGPLIATLRLDLARRHLPQLRMRRFEFKALHPFFDIHPFTLCGKHNGDGRVSLWARDHEGRLAMRAFAECS